MLKAKHYPKGEFLEAKLGGRPSHAWKSLMERLQIIKDKIQWRVGDGENIRLATDLWLPSLELFIETNLLEDLKNTTVSNLIDAYGSWDDDLIRDIFNQRDAQLILSLPRHIILKDDSLLLKND